MMIGRIIQRAFFPLLLCVQVHSLTYVLVEVTYPVLFVCGRRDSENVDTLIKGSEAQNLRRSGVHRLVHGN
jgi:hypothetical protein